MRSKGFKRLANPTAKPKIKSESPALARKASKPPSTFLRSWILFGQEQPKINESCLSLTPS